MAIVKTAISLPEPLFERVDAFARQQRISRSQLFARAVEEFLRRYESQALLDALNRAHTDSPSEEEKRTRNLMKQKQRKLVKGEW